MTSGDELIAGKIAEAFEGEDARRAASMLAAIDLPQGVLADRVRLAILKIAGTDLDRIEMLTRLAAVDPRDVIGEAEYPRQMRHPPGMATADMILADRAEYETWLDGGRAEDTGAR